MIKPMIIPRERVVQPLLTINHDPGSKPQIIRFVNQSIQHEPASQQQPVFVYCLARIQRAYGIRRTAMTIQACNNTLVKEQGKLTGSAYRKRQIPPCEAQYQTTRGHRRYDSH